MLEKSRLVHFHPHQHNFSIFYLMAEGLSPEENSILYLNNVLAHRYVSEICIESIVSLGDKYVLIANWGSQRHVTYLNTLE